MDVDEVDLAIGFMKDCQLVESQKSEQQRQRQRQQADSNSVHAESFCIGGLPLDATTV